MLVGKSTLLHTEVSHGLYIKYHSRLEEMFLEKCPPNWEGSTIEWQVLALARRSAKKKLLAIEDNMKGWQPETPTENNSQETQLVEKDCRSTQETACAQETSTKV